MFSFNYPSIIKHTCPKQPLCIHNFILLDCVIFSHQLYSYIILTDPLRLQIIVFSILYIIYIYIYVAEKCSMTRV
jgi:hypothetical protein